MLNNISDNLRYIRDFWHNKIAQYFIKRCALNSGTIYLICSKVYKGDIEFAYRQLEKERDKTNG